MEGWFSQWLTQASDLDLSEGLVGLRAAHTGSGRGTSRAPQAITSFARETSSPGMMASAVHRMGSGDVVSLQGS